MANAVEHYKEAEQLLEKYEKAVIRRRELSDKANSGDQHLTQSEIAEREEIWEFADDALVLAQIHATLAGTHFYGLDLK